MIVRQGTCMRAAKLIGGTAAGLIATTTALAQPNFQFLQPAAFGPAGSRLTDISANGSVLTASQSSGPASIGSYWIGTQRFDIVEPQFPTPSSTLHSASSNGQFLAGDFIPAGGQSSIFSVSPSGQFNAYPIAGGSRVRLPNISDNGSIIAAQAEVVESDASVSARRVIRYTSTSTWDVIAPPVTAIQSQHIISDMSGDGNVIVGAAAIDNLETRPLFPTIWRNGVGSSWLPTPADTTFAVASTVSADGNVIAGEVTTAVGGTFFAMWSDNLVTTYSLPSGQNRVFPTHVSDDGQIVTGNVRSFTGVDAGFIWTPATGTVTARDYLLNAGVSIPLGPDQQFLSILDPIVSADGTTIAGTISIFNTVSGMTDVSFFRATIPAPSSLLLVAAASLFTSTRRRTRSN